MFEAGQLGHGRINLPLAPATALSTAGPAFVYRSIAKPVHDQVHQVALRVPFAAGTVRPQAALVPDEIGERF